MVYCCKDYKNVTRENKFLRSRFFVCLLWIWKLLLQYKKIFKPGARKFDFLKYETFFLSKLFSFFVLESYFLKYKRNIRIESFISRKIRNFLILNLESSISWKIRSFFGADFYNFVSRFSLKIPFPEI